MSTTPTTPEEVFDKLIEQGGPSVSGAIGCRLRGSNGRKCALGWLIPDEAYYPEMEKSPVASARKFAPHLSQMVLLDMQGAHDMTSAQLDVDRWAENLAREWQYHRLPRRPKLEKGDTT